ncbi:MAG: cytochrome c oxidase subunit 3 [Rickettsiaceae bacterium H1]|nr:cytochrome c oxidase subunit 3 [Rickettsiaceae bacterium H1]
MKSKNHDYHLIDPSPWPLLTSLFLFISAFGGVAFIHHWSTGIGILLMGALLLTGVVSLWCQNIVKEAIIDKAHTFVVRQGLRIGIILLILAELMFFVVFFWSFFKAWLDPAEILDGLWPALRGSWPPKGIKPINVWDIPFLNTLILLLSGTTVTWAHYSLLYDNKKELIQSLALTVLLGTMFLILQVIEYVHLPFAFREEGTKAIYSSNFYMATGFHGIHVLLGVIFLSVCLSRGIKGQFSKVHHVGFEFAAWYWHFVDIVWLFLFTFVYWLSSF